MEIPLVRFPGGTDVDYIDWRDMIDHVPGREGPRPATRRRADRFITNRFGYDEYFNVRDEMGWQTILVVNLLDGLARRRPLKEAALQAAGLVAYCNAPVGAPLPEGMPDWPAIRAKNGRSLPWGVQYVQLGNEMWMSYAQEQVRKATGLDGEALARWYIEVYRSFIRAIRDVDPQVEIILCRWNAPEHSRTVLTDPYIRSQVRYLAEHAYAPGPANRIQDPTGQPADTSGWTDATWWWIWATMPGAHDESGQNIAFGPSLQEVAELGYYLAATEWNWNGWNWERLGGGFDAPAAGAIGAAGWIHGMMRQGEIIRIATQSILLGIRWPIAAIFGPSGGTGEPFYNPQGFVTTFYRKHHGDHRLQTELNGVEIRPQPFRVGWGAPQSGVAVLDVLATANEKTVYIHAINRDFEREYPLEIRWAGAWKVAERADHHLLRCALRSEAGAPAGKGLVTIETQPASVKSKMVIHLPPRSVSILEVPRLDSGSDLP